MKHKLTLRVFKPKIDFSIDLVVGVQKFGKIFCQTPYVTRSFDAFVSMAICRLTYVKFWPIVAKFEGDKVRGNGDRIVDNEAIKGVCLMFHFLSVNKKNNMFELLFIYSYVLFILHVLRGSPFFLTQFLGDRPVLV